MSYTKEYEVKAAFLYNFARFTDWPTSDEESPFTFCILGTDPFGKAIDDLEKKTIRGRQIQINRNQRFSKLINCQVLFISISKERKISKIFKAISNLPVLTISEMDNFVAKGGIIQFLIEEEKVRFKINQKAAEKVGLKISSNLLKLSK